MALENEQASRQQQAEQSDQHGMPTSLTYDPTQGVGTDTWQESVRAAAEYNSKLRQAGSN